MIDSRLPGFAGADRQGRWKIIAITLALALTTAALTSYFQFGFNLLTMRSTVGAEQAAGDAIEAGKEPFTTTVTPSNDVESAFRDNWVDAQWIIFDEPLTAQEQAAVVAHPLGIDFTVPEFLTLLNGFTHKPTLVYPGSGPGVGGRYGRASFPYKMTLQSDRSHAVSIRAMEATDLRCSKSRVTTVIHLPPEGGEELDDVAVDLLGGTPAPLLREVTGQKLHPYFSRKYIELGNGQTSWAANLNTLTGNGACSWSFQVSYVNDGAQHTTKITSPNFWTPGLPDRPPQLLEFRPDGRGWRCWGDRIAPTTPCAERPPADAPSASTPSLSYWEYLPEAP
ncbi:hypothetical protein ACIBUY_07130 [Streptomyces sp. NPDC050085]|uniref:hypothetical protein n=1 Tax=Streptomyces sp. NPDC050085 TaxID=3365600 RepID=UPI0037B80D58